MAAPVGAAVSEKVSLFVGISESLADAVKVRGESSTIDWLTIAVRAGAVFDSATVRLKVFVVLKAGVPLSLTETVTGYFPGPCSSVGVQVRTPVSGLSCAPE